MQMTKKFKSARILLVEDDQSHADLIRMSLEDNGFDLDIQHVMDGAEAIEYLHKEGEYSNALRPDFILLDLNLPKLSGHEVLDQIKSNDSLRSIPVVVLTTSANELDRAQAYEHHANSYLTKPTDFQMFQDMVHDLRSYWAKWNKLPA